MGLQEQLNLKKGFAITEHEAVLNIYYTASQIKKKADVFFRRFGLTDVQFNALALLYHQTDEKDGLSQARLSEMMLVNRANVTGLIDRMEKAGLVIRTADSDDRRFKIIKMTEKGRQLFLQVDPQYVENVKKIMAHLTETEQEALIRMLEEVRR